MMKRQHSIFLGYIGFQQMPHPIKIHCGRVLYWRRTLTHHVRTRP